MSSKLESFSLDLIANTPEQQLLIKDIFEEVKDNYVERVNIKIKDKKYLPYEIEMQIIIQFVATISVTLVIKLLDKLWEKLKQNKITLILKEIPTVQTQAEKYLEKIGVIDHEIKEMIDHGLYTAFIFSDNKKELHYLYISKTDLQVFNYSRRKSR